MLEISHISKIFKIGSEEFTAVVDATFKIEKGDYVAVSGPSGSP
jgi:ABC-type lipoprotein export system ATPase subunit